MSNITFNVRMKRFSELPFFLALAAVILTGTLRAQEKNGLPAAEYIQADYDRAGGIYHSYEFSEIEDTPAPKGFKPFYISHFGRHGSRFHTSDNFFDSVIGPLQKAKEAGLLTETGENLLRETIAVKDESEGMYGQLAPRGGREHAMLAKRMYGRFPEIFNSKSRKEVHCVSSTIQRCIVSMCWFTNALKGENPALDFDFVTGEKFMNYISFDHGITDDIMKKSGIRVDSLMNALVDPARIMSELFTDPQKASETIGDPRRLVKYIYMCGSICQDMDYTGIDLYKYFTFDELVTQWKIYNNRMYVNHCNSIEYGDTRTPMASNLLKDIIDKADAAIADGKTAADLRFGHDTGIMPLLAFIGIDGMDVRCRLKDADKYWNSSSNIPMAANLQIVFYRNKKGDILVKFLHNEQEKTINGPQSDCKPYYKWEDVKKYFTPRLKSYSF